jgi:ribonuclease G
LRQLYLYKRNQNLIAAICIDERLEDLALIRKADGSRGEAGCLYKAEVIDRVKSMHSVYVDVGLERPALLKYSKHIELPERGGRLLIQLKNEAHADKPAMASYQIQLVGDYFVYLPGANFVTTSREYEAFTDDRLRLLAWLDTQRIAMEGWIVRQSARTVEEHQLESEMQKLRSEWQKIIDEYEHHQTENGLLESSRDQKFERVSQWFSLYTIEEIVLDASVSDEQEFLRTMIKHSIPCRVLKNNESEQYFLSLRNQIEKATLSKYWLPSGGFLTIHQTPAMVVIDVNSGKFDVTSSPDALILKTNFEAASEIVRLIKLRSLAGIIVVDFIRMEQDDLRQQVKSIIDLYCCTDYARWNVAGFTQLGLFEMTRQRISTFTLQDVL